MSKRDAIVGGVMIAGLFACGCASTPPKSETETLSEVTQLTTGFDRAGEAYFSDDMKWVIFQATPKGEAQYQMYVAPIVASKSDVPTLGRPVRISPSPSRNTCGFFSPGAESILFASSAGKEVAEESTSQPGYQRSTGNYRWDFSPNVEIFRADNWKPAMETAEPDARFNFAKHALTDNNAYDAECAFSPDGKWIVFASNRDADPLNARNVDLYVMRPDGTGVTRLTVAPGYDGGPFFSPDGKRLVYRSDRKGNDLLQIFTADLVFDSTSGQIMGITNEKQLTDGNDVNWGPYWHPSGDYIIYAGSAMGHHNYELFMTRADGGRTCRITFTNGFDGLPVFSPDGKYLMWSSKRTTDNTTQVFAAKFRLPAYLKRAK
jgi:Tol biopolymer transport system component